MRQGLTIFGLAASLLFFGGFISANAQAFKANQIISPITQGVLYADGAKTSNITATTGPTVAFVTATSSAATSFFNGALTVSGNTKLLTLAGSGTRCVHVDNTGQVSVASGDCGTSGGSASTTLLADTNIFSGHDTFSNLITGSVSGNAGTATALAANGTNCSAGSYPLGVDASGNSESCTVATTGTVTAVSVASSNGFAGSSSGGATPALTISTSITGLLKGNGTAISAAALSDFPTMAANTLIGNGTGVTAAPTALATSTLNIGGNAGTATALQTARNINGTSFNGTADITITAAAGTLTGTTLNSTVVTSSLTALGTLSSLTVSGQTSLAHASSTMESSLTAYFGATASTTISSTGALTTPSLTVASISGVLKATSGLVAAAANGTDYTLITANTCTNQVFTAATAAGVFTCASVSNAMLTSSTISGVALGGTLFALTATNSTLTFSGSYTGTAAQTVGLNLANTNNWTSAIGIGTSSPFAALSISTSTQTSGLVSLFVVGSTTNATLFNILGNGNVGIGTTSPSQLLSVGGAAGSTNGNALFSGTVTANNFFDYSVSGSTCIGETNGLIGTSNCVSSIASSGSTLTVSSPTGAVNVDINLSHANTWAAQQTFSSGQIRIAGSVSGNLVLANSSGGTLTFPSVTDTVAVLGTAQSFTALQTFSNTLGYSALFSGGNVGIGTSTPWAQLSVSTTTQSSGLNPLFVVGSTTNATLFNILGSGNVGIGTSSPGTTFSIQGVGNFASALSTFYNQVTFLGETVGFDATNAWSGRLSPTRSFGLSTGTTTTWTASTTGSGYSPFMSMPFAGTLKQIRCLTDQSYLGINIQVNGSNATPSYFIASSTAGVYKFTGGNTFTLGQKILLNAGTTTTAGTLEVACTLDATETP